MKKVVEKFFLVVRFFLTNILRIVGYEITDPKWENWEQFIKFILVGCSNAFITLCVYYVVLAFGKDLYILGNTLGYVAGILNSYYWNSKTVFSKQNTQKLRNFFRMFSCYIITYFIQTALLYCFVGKLYISELLAPIIVIVITTPINFFLNKYYAFK